MTWLETAATVCIVWSLIQTVSDFLRPIPQFREATRPRGPGHWQPIREEIRIGLFRTVTVTTGWRKISDDVPF